MVWPGCPTGGETKVARKGFLMRREGRILSAAGASIRARLGHDVVFPGVWFRQSIPAAALEQA
jgi:hypothetical protein